MIIQNSGLRFMGISLSAIKSINYQKNQWKDNFSITLYDSNSKLIEADAIEFNGRLIGRSSITKFISEDLAKHGKKSMLLNPKSDRPRLSALGKSILKLAIYTMDTSDATAEKNDGFTDNNPPVHPAIKAFRDNWETFYQLIEKNKMRTLLSPKSPETIAGKVWALQLREEKMVK